MSVAKLELTSLESTKLGDNALAALRLLGFDSAERFYESLAVAPEEFGAFLSISTEQIQQMLVDRIQTLGHGIPPEDRAQLESLPCATGLFLGGPSSGTVAGLVAESLIMDGIIDEASLSQVSVNLADSMPPIKDQGQRQTCAAHAIVRCREFHWSKTNSLDNFDLSEQFAHWHMKEKDGRIDLETSTLQAGLDTLMTIGVCLESSFPYVHESYHPTDLAQRGERPDRTHDEEALAYRVNRAEAIAARDLEALKGLLVKGIPIAYGIPTFKSWKKSIETKGDGRITLPPPPEHPEQFGHAITLIGFANDPGFVGNGYFIFDNSWGTGWSKLSPHGPGRGTMPFKYATKFGISAAAILK